MNSYDRPIHTQAELEAAWREGNNDGTSTNLSNSVENSMSDLKQAGRDLLGQQIPAPDGSGIVGPSFQFRP